MSSRLCTSPRIFRRTPPTLFVQGGGQWSPEEQCRCHLPRKGRRTVVRKAGRCRDRLLQQVFSPGPNFIPTRRFSPRRTSNALNIRQGRASSGRRLSWRRSRRAAAQAQFDSRCLILHACCPAARRTFPLCGTSSAAARKPC